MMFKKSNSFDYVIIFDFIHSIFSFYNNKKINNIKFNEINENNNELNNENNNNETQTLNIIS